jgi:predicted small lipoprotein YifL
MPRFRCLVRITPFVLAALLLAACGNKGPLVKPGEAPAPASDTAH